MKKILSLLLAISLFFSLIGCAAGDLQTPSQPQLEVQPTEQTSAATEPSTEYLVEFPTEETESVPEKTQPPQEEEIIDTRPHPADVAERDQQQDQDEQNGTQQEQNPDDPSTQTSPSQDTSEQPDSGTSPTQPPTESNALDPNGHYTSKNDVALYIYTYGRLPSNYITKDAGDSQYGSYKNIPSYMNIGGDRFYNREGLLPGGYTYYECDIGTSGGSNRGARRLVFTTSGIIYYTSDHYESFTRLY